MDHGRGGRRRAQRVSGCVELSVRRGKGQREVRREAVLFEVTKAVNKCGQSSALAGGRGGKQRKQSARGKAIVGLLGDHKSNKKSQYNDFSRKVQFGEINLKQLLVIKTLESVKSLACTLPCYTVGKTLRHVGGQVHYGHVRKPTPTHTHAHRNDCIIDERLLYLRHICMG